SRSNGTPCFGEPERDAETFTKAHGAANPPSDCNPDANPGPDSDANPDPDAYAYSGPDANPDSSTGAPGGPMKRLPPASRRNRSATSRRRAPKGLWYTPAALPGLR
ncbi:MAG: hypothetical protein ABI571_03385, partial [Actinomycetota bacterium]